MDYEALVIGGGPSGSACARLLARLGHRVLLVHRPGGERSSLAQSIPPSARRILEALDMLTAVEQGGFHPWRGNTVWWAHQAPRVETFPEGVHGWQVVRDRFDELLRRTAVEAGARVRTGIVRDVQLPGEGRQRAAATVEDERGVERVAADYVLDCSGRTGVIARAGLRRPERSHHTVGLVGIWRSDDWGPTDDTHTLVASYADGWAWSIPTAADLRYVTVMVDPRLTALASSGVSADVYRAELGKVHGFAPMLARGTLVEGPWGADASLYCADHYSGQGFVLVGDAASFIDPLSSFGVKKALASGWLAAIATHTALLRPAMREEALAFYDRRERQVYSAYRRLAAEFAADAASESGNPYWNARADTPDDASPGEESEIAALARDPGVLAAFEDVRQRPELRLVMSDVAAIAPRPAVTGHEIAHIDHLVLPDWPNGIRYLRGVDLVELVRLAPAHADAGALYEACRQSRPHVQLPDFLGALAVLLARGALRHARAR